MNTTMNKRPFLIGTVAAVITAASLLAAQATPLRLDYTVNASGGGYFYDFKLSLDNHDGTFAPGQGWDWIIFGDTPSGLSVINDFAVTPGTFPIGPFSGLGSSGGGHNGPTFVPVVGAYWTPAAIGDFLHWSGTSSGFLGDGQLLFSSFVVNGGAAQVSFEVAHRVASLDLGGSASPAVPDGGSTLALLGGALTGLGFVRGRFRA
jgi:hypothetical protein